VLFLSDFAGRGLIAASRIALVKTDTLKSQPSAEVS
jgi:hypothetical protein